MKKAITIVLAITMILSLATACSGGSKDDGSKPVLQYTFEKEGEMTITGGSITDDSERGKVLTLDGGAKHASSASVETDVIGKTDWADGMSIAFWVKAANDDAGIAPLYAFSIVDHDAEGYIATTDSLEIAINTDGNSGAAEYPRVWADPAVVDATAQPVLTPGKWQHVAVTLSATEMVVYLDGQEYSKPALGPSSANFKLFIDQIHYCYGLKLGDWNCGWWDDIGSFAGSFDDVCVYNHALTAEEVASIVNPAASK